MVDQLPQPDREYIRRKKQIEIEYALPYMKPVAGPVSEPELRQKVRAALKELPKREWVQMQQELEEAWRETHGNKDCLYANSW